MRAGLGHAKPAAWAFEVGCGTGQATAPLTGFTSRVIATDVNLSMVDQAPQLPGYERVWAAALTLIIIVMLLNLLARFIALATTLKEK